MNIKTIESEKITLDCFYLFNENYQQCWWFGKTLALPNLFIRASEETSSLLLWEKVDFAKQKTDEELLCVQDTSSVSRCTSLRSVSAATFSHWRRLWVNVCYICDGRASAASGEFFDERICSACEMPQGAYRKPPARLVVMTYLP